MKSHTVTAVLEAPKEDVFAYLSEIDNLPKSATEFARELRFEDGRAKVVNGLGEFYFSIDADVGTGVIDMYAGPSEDELMLFPTRVAFRMADVFRAGGGGRVVPLPDGRSMYSFTMFQAPGMPDDLVRVSACVPAAGVENIRREVE